MTFFIFHRQSTEFPTRALIPPSNCQSTLQPIRLVSREHEAVYVSVSICVCVCRHTLGHSGLCEGGMTRGIKEIEPQSFNS